MTDFFLIEPQRWNILRGVEKEKMQTCANSESEDVADTNRDEELERQTNTLQN